jgi:serine/threonine protein phosphatase PrpC
MGMWDRLFRRARKKGQEVRDRERPGPEGDRRVDPLEIGQGTDIGKTRGANEDAFLTLKSLIGTDSEPTVVGLLMIADGMGGHAGGREASSMAIRVASSMLAREILLPSLESQPASATSRPIQEILSEATISANEAISRTGGDAGTTLTSVIVIGHSAYIAHVGDTRVYYLNGEELQQITQDHSLVNRLVELGQISAEEAQRHPQRNFLYRAVGQGPELAVDTYFQRLAKSSYLLLCTDGLWNQVSDEEMVEVIENTPSPQEACNVLIDSANARGGEDNITVVLAKVNY